MDQITTVRTLLAKKSEQSFLMPGSQPLRMNNSATQREGLGFCKELILFNEMLCSIPESSFPTSNTKSKKKSPNALAETRLYFQSFPSLSRSER